MSKAKTWVKRNVTFKRVALALHRALLPFVSIVNLRALPSYIRFLLDWRRFQAVGGKAALLDVWPCLSDRTATSRIDAHYFNQAVWAMRQIRDREPLRHIDIGSEVTFVGMLTTVTNVTFVDIRPLELTIPNYTSIAGSITALPFDSGSVNSISCLHVIEHIGLGRYGDPIDPLGPERAASEITRVLQNGGHAYISAPVGRPRVQFNGQRVLGIQDIPELFRGLHVVSFSMVDANGVLRENIDWRTAYVEERDTGMDCGLGMYIFRKD